MFKRDGLMRAVLAAPDDDLPRPVMADWFEADGQPERAELIRVQCRLYEISPQHWPSRTEQFPGERVALYRRRDAIVGSPHLAGWLTELPERVRELAEFRRGFVGALRGSGEQLLRVPDRVWDSHPIQAVWLRDYSLHLTRVLALTRSGRVRDFTLSGSRSPSGREADALADPAALAGTRRVRVDGQGVGVVCRATASSASARHAGRTRGRLRLPDHPRRPRRALRLPARRRPRGTPAGPDGIACVRCRRRRVARLRRP